MTLDGAKTKNDHPNIPQTGGGQHKPMGIQLIVCKLRPQPGSIRLPQDRFLIF